MNATRMIMLLLALTWISVSALSQSEKGANSTAPTIKVDVDLVTVNATVTDFDSRPVIGLGAENFQLWEDKIQQRIEYFSEEEVPVSVGIIFDVSGSMEGKIDSSRKAAVTFLKLGSPEDEYFLVEFSGSPKLTQDFTTDITKLQNRIIATAPGGRTAMLDAVYLGLEKLKSAHNPKKALLLITDGGDNHSRYQMGEIKEYLREQDVQIYTIGIGLDVYVDQLGFYPALAPYDASRRAPGLFERGVDVPPNARAYSPDRDKLEQLSDVSAGRAFFPNTAADMERICTIIAHELKTQYLIGYRSSNESTDGKWRTIKVKLKEPKGMGGLQVRSKSGYYAATR